MFVITFLLTISIITLVYFQLQPTEYITIVVKLYAVDNSYPHDSLKRAVLPYYHAFYHIHNDLDQLLSILEQSYPQVKYTSLRQIVISKGRASQTVKRYIKQTDKLVGFD